MKSFSKVRKIILNLLWILLSSIFLIFVTGLILAGNYEEKLKELSISKINQTINTKISVGHLDTRFIRTFPYLSIVLKNVSVFSSPDFNRQDFTGHETEILFEAENIYLQFNPIDLLRSKIRMRRVYAVNGNISLLVDLNGQTNYRVFHEDTQIKGRDSGKSHVFELDALKLSGFEIEFINLSKKTYSSTSLENIYLRGRFSGSGFTIGTYTDFVLHDYSRNGFRYANEYDISLRTIFEMDDNLAIIRDGEITLNTIRLATGGSIQFGEGPTLNLGMEARNINISTLLSSFPRKLREKIPFQAQGKGDLAIKVNGPITSTKMPSIQSVYVLNLNQLSFQKENLRDIKLKGTYTNGEGQRPSTTEIDVRKFRINDRNSIAEGSVTIRNLVSPSIRLSINGSIDAAQVFEMVPGNNGVKAKGKLLPDLTLSVNLKSFQDLGPSTIAKARLSGQMNVSGLNFRLKDFPEFSQINGNITFNDHAWSPELSLMMGNSDIEIKGRTDHIPEMLISEEKSINIQATINSKSLDLRPFFAKKPDNPTEKDAKRGFKPPSLMTGRLDYSIGEINNGYFTMRNVTGIMELAPGIISLPEISFDAVNGNANGSVSIGQGKNNDFYLQSNSLLKNIDLQQLFQVFGNFGQHNLRSEHVRGAVSGSVGFNAVFDSSFSIRKEKIITDAKLIIRNGELLDFEPMRKLSAFIELDELEHIRFSTLENTVLIRNNQMTIPEMEIKSNAFNITASGLHNFDGNFDYKLKILLSELLTRKTKPKSGEFQVLEEDRRASLYLSISGTSDDYKIKYDKKEALAAIKNDLQKEKTTLKTILHEEFGLFRKDSLKQVPKQEKPSFILDWGEDSVADPGNSMKQDIWERQKNKKREKTNNKDENQEYKLEWDDDEG